MSEVLNQRAQQILKILVERYIREGSPIGSKTLAEESLLGLSSATIRNILADLEDAGYLASPHTSAGRVPTELGYRFFVDTLLKVKSLQSNEVHELGHQFSSDLTLSSLLESASTMLSSLTRMIGVVALPKVNRVTLRQIEFLSLSANRVLVVLVLNNREVQNRIIHTDRIYSASELQTVSNYLNSHCSGKDLMAVRKELLDAMEKDKDCMTKLIQTAMEVTNKAIEADNQDCIIAVGDLRVMFEAFTQKQEVLNLLNHAFEAEGVQIFIGKESGYEMFNQCSIVTASYAAEGQLIGTLGVIGPTRMPYDRVITAVDVTAKLLSAALNQV